MSLLKNSVLTLEEEVLALLNSKKGKISLRVEKAKQKLATAMTQAQKNDNNLVQLYCCMGQAHLEVFRGNKIAKLIDTFQKITKPETVFILASEKGKAAHPDEMLLDADTYGFYYALNDHYSKLYDEEEYCLSKNGSEGNPLITSLIKLCYQDDHGLDAYYVSDEGYVKKYYNGLDSFDSDLYLLQNMFQKMGVESPSFLPSNNKNPYSAKEALFRIFENTKVFSDTSMAFVGGSGITYNDIVFKLSTQFKDSHFKEFSGKTNEIKLDMDTATWIAEIEKNTLDYVVTSNVLNAFGHHVMDEERDEIFASCAKILKQGGKAIHVVEKVTDQKHLNVNLNRSLHRTLGQDLVYSFFREKNAMDLDYDFKKIFLTHQQEVLKAQADPFSVLRELGLEEEISKVQMLLQIQGIDEQDELDEDTLTALGEIDEQLELIESSIVEGKRDDFRTTLLVLYQTNKPMINDVTVGKARKSMNQYQNRFNYYHKPVYVEKPGLDQP